MSPNFRLLQVLEPCQKSIAYQPPNPWTMAILGLLAEIYSMPNLKMNLKFDIEVSVLNNDFRKMTAFLRINELFYIFSL